MNTTLESHHKRLTIFLHQFNNVKWTLQLVWNYNEGIRQFRGTRYVKYNKMKISLVFMCVLGFYFPTLH